MKWRHWLRLWPARSRRLRTARPCVPTVVWCARFFEFEILLCALRAASKTITLNLAAVCQSRWRSRLGRKDRQSGNQIVGSVAQAILPASAEGEEKLDGRQDCLHHEDPFRWVFLSDVCKHCEEAGCLEACPTGSIVRTEVGSVLVQNDVCNGCGYCVVSCAFGLIDRAPSPLRLA